MEVFIYLDEIYSDVVPLNFITKLLLFLSKMKECLPLINANRELSTLFIFHSVSSPQLINNN